MSVAAVRLSALVGVAFAAVLIAGSPVVAQDASPAAVVAQPLPAPPAPAKAPAAAAVAAPAAPAAASPAPMTAAAPAGSPPAAAASTTAAPGAPDAAVAVPAKPKPKKIAKPALPSEYALSEDPTPTFQANTFFTTAKASERYAAIVDAGGWPMLPPNVRLGPTSKGSVVATLRLRLGIEGDLAQGIASDAKWDPELTAAVKHYQERVGLRQTGIVAGATLKALNVPADVRFKQLASSSQRLAGVQFSFDDRYVAVNIPSASVEAVENGAVVKRYVAVVGDVTHPSPEVQAKAVAVNLNPTWTLPTSIIKKEIIPKMRKDPGYLSRQRIRILDGKGNPVDAASIDWSGEKAANYTLRQDSGAGNSLGSIRINMPNKFAVYMHDTPSKRLFGADYRFLSHGCVRVSGVYNLAEWLLQGSDGAWSVDAMKAQVALASARKSGSPRPSR